MKQFIRPLSTAFALCLLLMGCDAGSSAVLNNSDKKARSETAIDCHSVGDSATAMPKPLNFRVVAKHPHDPNSFTQGLIYHKGYLYESTGLYGKSSLQKLRLGDKQAIQRLDIDAQYFAEGLTLLNDQLIQLTWKSGKVFTYDADSLSPKGEGKIQGQGWGITHNGNQLITSDGSAQLSFRNPTTFEQTRVVTATYAGRPLSKINELEWVDGCLFANIWHNDSIAVLEPDTGTTRYTIDVSPLARVEKQHNRESVANGIAYRPDTGTFLVTGKNWQWLYEIELLAR